MTTADAAAARVEAERRFESGDLAGSLGALDAALEGAADDAALHGDRSLVLLRLGRTAEALECARRAHALAPDSATLRTRLGEALRVAGQLDEALGVLGEATAAQPDLADAWTSLGLTLSQRGEPSSALAAHRRAMQIGTRPEEAWNNLGVCHLALAAPRLACAAFERALAIRPDYRAAASNLLMAAQYDPDASADQLRACAARRGRLWETPSAGRAGRRSRPSGKRLHLGYVSADLGAHPVGWFLRDVLAGHAAEGVTVTCYSARSHDDPVARELRDHASRWVDISAMDDAAAAQQVRIDGVDVLVDLGGHTAGARLGVFALHPAPVQVSWLGYFASTGLEAMDATLLGATQAGEAGHAYFHEALVELPSSQFVYRGPDDAPAPHIRSPAQLTFGSFNNTAKLNDRVLVAWARLLAAVPGARLLLKWQTLADAPFRAQLLSRFAAEGIDPTRIELRGASSHAQMLDEYADVDVALDPFPFSGALTTCEALWMGVPVVTLPWQRPVSRQSMAILAELGLGDLVARSVDDYVRIAADLAMDFERIRVLRATLRERMRARSQANARTVAREVENACAALLAGADRGVPPEAVSPAADPGHDGDAAASPHR